MIDSHCHLADEIFVADIDDVAARARAAGLSSAMCILSADEPEELARVPRVREAWPAIQFAVAIHPHRAGAYAGRVPDASDIVRRGVIESAAVAVGEIGLDYHYDHAPRDVQREVFAAQLDVAMAADLPVVIHTREATDDTFAVLREAGAGRVRGVMHCFSGTVDDARRALEIGFYLSFAGILTFPKAESLRDVARFAPVDRVIVETDAPFLAPVPHRGKRNEPAWVAETVARLAALQGCTAREAGDRTAANFSALVWSSRPAGTASRVDTPPKPVF
jgi:TatD DNase family protein